MKIEEYKKERKEELKKAVEKADFIEKSIEYLKENIVEHSDKIYYEKSQKSKTAIKRQITNIRAELLELEKLL